MYAAKKKLFMANSVGIYKGIGDILQNDDYSAQNI